MAHSGGDDFLSFSGKETHPFLAAAQPMRSTGSGRREHRMSELLRPVTSLPAGTSVARYIAAKAVGGGDLFRELAFAERSPRHTHVVETLKLATKASVPAGSTTDASWAAPLSAYAISSEALVIMRGMSILGALES